MNNPPDNATQKPYWETVCDLIKCCKDREPDAKLLGNVTSNDLITLGEEVIRLAEFEVKVSDLLKEYQQKQFSQSNCRLGLPNFPHPFVYAMDALITDPGLVKETRERLKVAVKYFNDPSYF